MLLSSPASTTTRGQVLEARIKRIIPIGLIVELGDGREGLIREREIAWDAEARQGWRNRYRPGQALEVAPIKEVVGERPEFSLRLVHHDPWLDAEDRYPIGSLVEGVVTGVMPYGAFIELEPGITGLLHTSQLPAWEKRNLKEIFWPGDQVKAIVSSLNLKRREMGLSLQGLDRKRWQKGEIIPAPTRTPADVQTTMQAQRDLLQELLARPRQRVLVVEDDEDQRKAVVAWLQHVNQIADAATCGEEALEAIERFQPDLVLMDVGLPGMNGIQAATCIREQWSGVRCILMTDWGRAEHYAAELNDLAEVGVSLILKPLLPEDLLHALLATTTGIVLSPLKSRVRAQIQTTPVEPKLLQKSTAIEYLTQLRSTFGADKVVLFELDSTSQQVSIVAQRGPATLRNSTLPELIYTPIIDVAEKRVTYVVEVRQVRPEKRLVHLASLLDFRSCVGVPVPTSLSHRYALFLFFAEEMPIPETWVAQIKTTAAAIGLWLERRHFARQAAAMLRVTMLGQLARALVHEVSGRVTPINLAAERLQAAMDAIEHSALRSPDQVKVQTQLARQELRNLLEQTQSLTKTTRAFSRMARGGQEELIILQDIIDEAVEILRDAAKTGNITISVPSMPRLYLTRTQVTYFQQSLVNVLQNAIQQIGQTRPKQPGHIEVRLKQSLTAEKSLLQIEIEDDGPGIHGNVWDRIFEADYTTRPDGSGLGLYISRNLMESQGGSIYVKDSHVGWGSTFVVELPTVV